MANPTPHLQALIDRDPDLVDRIFEYLLAEFPHLAGPRFAQAKRAVRSEFNGERVRIGSPKPRDRADLVEATLAHFNGRNASEVARRLGIGRATVYRLIKQAGHAKQQIVSGSAQIETAPALRSKATATPNSSEPDQWPSPKPTSTPSTKPLPPAN